MRITLERLKSILFYNPDTGLWHFIHQNEPLKFHFVQRYPTARIDGKPYYLHRLAWFYMTGEWPTKEIDHVDNTRDNNKWNNLREANRQQNGRNCKVRKHNKSGVKWVYKMPNGRYRVTMTVDKKRINVGIYKTLDEAKQASIIRASQIHKEFMYKYLE